MTTVDITPAKRRFGLKPRKQWSFMLTAENGTKLSDRDTYANIGDVLSMLRGLREQPMRVRIHYDTGVETVQLW